MFHPTLDGGRRAALGLDRLFEQAVEPYLQQERLEWEPSPQLRRQGSPGLRGDVDGERPPPHQKSQVRHISRNHPGEAPACLSGAIEPDPDLRDTESVPLSEPVDDFFAREVVPHVPDAWINQDRRDAKDAEVGLVGYEINFNREFYTYTPPRPLKEIEADIREIERGIS